MSAAPRWPGPCSIVATGATGASGLSARALAAAVWSNLARFELYADTECGLPEALRISPCPLFDSASPTRERITEMFVRAWGALALPQVAPQTVPLYLVGPKASDRPDLATDWAARLTPAPKQLALGGAGAWAQALLQAGVALHAGQAPCAIGLAATDSLMATPTLQNLFEAGLMSCESRAEGIIAGEAAAALALSTTSSAQALNLTELASVLGVGYVPIPPPQAGGSVGATALVQAVRAATGGIEPRPVHTILWDIAHPDGELAAMAEAIAELTPELGEAALVRPFMQLGCLGAAFGPVAAILAIEGARAGVTAGGRCLILTLDADVATAVLIDAPWQPHIMLQDLQAG